MKASSLRTATNCTFMNFASGKKGAFQFSRLSMKQNSVNDQISQDSEACERIRLSKKLFLVIIIVEWFNYITEFFFHSVFNTSFSCSIQKGLRPATAEWKGWRGWAAELWPATRVDQPAKRCRPSPSLARLIRNVYFYTQKILVRRSSLYWLSLKWTTNLFFE